MKIVLLVIFLLVVSTSSYAKESTCFGTTKMGRLENGVSLLEEGENFVAFSGLGVFLGRTYVHSKVYEVVVKAYDRLANDIPEKKFMYGETGFKTGGKFRPHKTHQNGLSVDFMVPVINSEGESVYLPTHPFNKWGYSIEFYNQGEYENYRIDFEALADHLIALHRAAHDAGIAIQRVIFDPVLQKFLFATKRGKDLKSILKFSKKPSWVRHDEHYHVDFKVNCKPM